MKTTCWTHRGSVVILLLLVGCDLSSLPMLSKRMSDEDSKAVGAACRHAGRALEDCFTLNPEAKQASVFDGWKTMNDYMAETKIEVVTPQVVVKKPEEHPEPVAEVKPVEALVEKKVADADKEHKEAGESKDKKSGKNVAEKKERDKPWIRKKDQS